MDVKTLTEIGLTGSQAKAYIFLVQHGSATPPDLATHTDETRSNAYKLLERLEELGLARKDEHAKKALYRIGHPSALEELAKKARETATQQEQRVKDAMPALLNFFYTYSDQPGIRFFQGKNGIRHIFEDMLRTRRTIYLLRSPADVRFYDEEFFAKFRKQRARLGIQTRALTPDIASAVHNDEADKQNNFIRTWLPADAYDANVEWDIYGDKVALISYGEEAIGMIIESPQIAASFRQIFELLATCQPTAQHQS